MTQRKTPMPYNEYLGRHFPDNPQIRPNYTLKTPPLECFPPQPPDDPYWTHPRVTVTPHIAGVTRPETASQAIVARIARHRRGEPFLHVVDRARGY